MTEKQVRYGMVGGGEGAFIGAIHRMAASLDNRWRLCAGVFSSDQERNQRSGVQLGLATSRIYENVDAMITAEKHLPAEQRIQAVVIVTPNHLHADTAIMVLKAGFHVLSEKPMAVTMLEAQNIAIAARDNNRHYALAFTYSGYPLIEEARQRILQGHFGDIRLIQVEYLQGWLSQPIENSGNRQAEWRTDPSRAGLGGCLGDIGTHAFHLAEHVSGLRATSLSAELTTHVTGRRLDDDVTAMLRFENGARGVLKASQVAAGEENGLRLKIHGEYGGLEWSQMEPNSLTLRWHDRPTEILRTAGPGLSDGCVARTRTPAGHPEGYIEAFANIYNEFAQTIEYQPLPSADILRKFDSLPGIREGLRTMNFIETAISNSKSEKKWSEIPYH